MAQGTSDGKLVSRSTKTAPARQKPSVRVSESDLPAIKDWEVGKKYKVHAVVEMRSHSKGDRFGYDEAGAKKQHEADLVIHRIGASDGGDAGDGRK